jgi:hypothetical protein
MLIAQYTLHSFHNSPSPSYLKRGIFKGAHPSSPLSRGDKGVCLEGNFEKNLSFTKVVLGFNLWFLVLSFKFNLYA